jgi:hypothetical protein
MVAQQVPVALRCPRCAGPMRLEVTEVSDYACLLCGEYRFVVPPRRSSRAPTASLPMPRRPSRRRIA